MESHNLTSSTILSHNLFQIKEPKHLLVTDYLKRIRKKKSQRLPIAFESGMFFCNFLYRVMLRIGRSAFGIRLLVMVSSADP